MDLTNNTSLFVNGRSCHVSCVQYIYHRFLKSSDKGGFDITGPYGYDIDELNGELTLHSSIIDCFVFIICVHFDRI